jgi:hypothetical protein
MMLAWRQGGHIAKNCVLLDPVFPWPALHHGREAMRLWAARQNLLRAAGDAGPTRLMWGLLASVKEDGDAVISVWPGYSNGSPRPWSDGDNVWKPALADMVDFVGRDLLCAIDLQWMPGGIEFQRSETVASLRDRKGFWGWRKGEREPTAKLIRANMHGQFRSGRPLATGAASWP